MEKIVYKSENSITPLAVFILIKMILKQLKNIIKNLCRFLKIWEN